MKTIKYRIQIIIIFISILTICTPIKAQVVGFVGKQAVKQGAKYTLKQTAKQFAKEAAKKSAIKSATKTLSKEAIQETTELAAKKVASEMVQTASTKIVKEIIESGTKKQIKKRMTSKLVKDSGEEVFENMIKKTTREEVEKLAREGGKRIAFNTSKNINKTVLNEVAQKEAIEKALNKRAADEWLKYSGGKATMNKLLLDDIADNPQLRKLFSNNPQLLEPYCNMIGSNYRKDITMLRYLGNNANNARKMYYKAPRKREWLSGNDLSYQDISGVNGNKTIILHKSTGEILGYQTGNAKDGYIIELTKTSNPLGDLYPMSNTTYRGSNFTLTTDRYGRAIRMKYSADKNVKKASRDKNHIGKIKSYKSDYDVLGNQKSRTGTYDDVAGHIQPDSWGGESNFLNIVPQNNKMNAKGLWKDSEMAGLRAAKKGGNVVREIVLEYPDKTTLRPSAMKVTQTLNGKIQKVKGQNMNGVVFKNEMVKIN